jgi:hypothetical protein
MLYGVARGAAPDPTARETASMYVSDCCNDFLNLFASILLSIDDKTCYYILSRF